MLIHSPRHTEADRKLWHEYELTDTLHHRISGIEHKVRESLEAIEEFVMPIAGRCYAGVSWGKDSVVMAHLLRRVTDEVPLVWIRLRPFENPDCEAVRNAFRGLSNYHEIKAWQGREDRRRHVMNAAWAQANARFGKRYLSGLRGDESAGRSISVAVWGVSSPNACRPLAHWTAQDVFAYLAAYGLPVHPVYAMLGGGRWERQHLRVAQLAGKHGDGHGRNEWEREYYGDVLRRLDAS